MASPFCPCLACSSWASLTASPTSIKTARLASAVTVPRQARVPTLLKFTTSPKSSVSR
ncbi:hypothetical protein [Otoolea muris]|uniref:hypothetical protein n=1 Tax=Otoolea muris TaxID=2941515 RepID=UPI0020422050|nr:hypothetical protein [Otoolea muris]